MHFVSCFFFDLQTKHNWSSFSVTFIYPYLSSMDFHNSLAYYQSKSCSTMLPSVYWYQADKTFRKEVNFVLWNAYAIILYRENNLRFEARIVIIVIILILLPYFCGNCLDTYDTTEPSQLFFLIFGERNRLNSLLNWIIPELF